MQRACPQASGARHPHPSLPPASHPAFLKGQDGGGAGGGQLPEAPFAYEAVLGGTHPSSQERKTTQQACGVPHGRGRKLFK